MSRALGDILFKENMEHPVLFGKPDISITLLPKLIDHSFLIVATDGLWDFILEDQFGSAPRVPSNSNISGSRILQHRQNTKAADHVALTMEAKAQHKAQGKQM
jgi:serine/threonine protein phosphatase PrpC